jgi:penicillin-binding protein 1A
VITLLRRLGLTLLVLLLLPLIVLAALWPLTPSVADAEQRVQARLAAHSAQDLGALPRPDRAAQALIATEDSRFYTHHGIDLQGVVRAAIGFAQGSRDPGGATLDQQLAKNLYTSDSLLAKVEQVELAVKLEARYSKPEILEMYLAEVYFGHGYFGLSAASRGFFDRAPADLTWGQASLLAGLVNAPSAYDPLTHLRRARQRQRHVLDRLVAVGTLTRAGADAAYLSPVHLVPT